MNMLIPLYELTLMSSDSLIGDTKVVSLGPGEDARIRCTLQDSGYDPQSLFLSMNNRNMTGTQRGHNIIYDILDYDTSKGELVFDCAARRRNQKFQTMYNKQMWGQGLMFGGDSNWNQTLFVRATLYFSDATFVSKCCPGKECQFQDGAMVSPWIWISGLVCLSLGCVILSFLLMYSRKMQKNRTDGKTFLNQEIDIELKKAHEDEVDLEVLYDQADNLLHKPPDPSDYDNIRYDRETSTQT